MSNEKNIPIFTEKDYVNPKDLHAGNTLIDIMNSYLSGREGAFRLESAKNKAKQQIRFYPSNIGACERAVVYKMLGYKGSPKDPESVQTMENGTSFHNRMEEQFAEMGIMIAPELSLRDEELHISGRSDAIIWNFLEEESDEIEEKEIVNIDLRDPDGQLIYSGNRDKVLLVEFKSIKDKQFNLLPLKKPKREHEKQLQLYFYLTGIQKGIIYYENKNNQKTKEYLIEYDEELIQEVLKEISRLVAFAERKELPERPFLPTDIKCRYCDFRDICHVNTNPFTFEDLFKTPEEIEEDFPF